MIMAVRHIIDQILRLTECFGTAYVIFSNCLRQIFAYDRFDDEEQDEEQSLQREIDNKREHVANLKNQLEKCKETLQCYYSTFSPQEESLAILEEQKARFDAKDCMKLLNEIVDDCFETMKDTLLSVKDESEEEFRNQKEQYRAYGLLLSACIKTNKNEKSIVAVAIKKKYNSTSEIEHIQSAVDIAHSMLILLPPLLVIQPQWQDDNVQDTNRVTWDDTRRQPLIYYRPVVVYGNQLHVAVKGLVGNIKTFHS